MKLAALDLGSNSFHLLVAQASGASELSKVGARKAVLRLGTEVQERGQLGPAAYHRAFAAVRDLAAAARELGAEKSMVVATSALRDARNGLAFCDECRDRLGLDVELLSGDEEARLAYLGARSAVPLSTGRVLVADIGGGSVELAGGEGPSCDSVQTLPLGFLRVGRAFPTHEQGGTARLVRYVQAACEEAHFRVGRGDTLLLSGGTARAIGKLLGAPCASVARVLELCHQLCAASEQSLLALGVEPARAVSLSSAAAVVAGVVAALGQREVRISPRGLREGVILRELRAGSDHRPRLLRPPVRRATPTAARGTGS